MMLHPSLVRRFLASLAVGLTAAGASACGDVVRNGRSPVIVVVDQMSATPGGGRGASVFTANLVSDVITNLTSPDPCTASNPCPTFYNDLGRVDMHLAPKDIAIEPTSNNQVTITRYHVSYRRADGHNTPGVDVPYGFDGAATGTIPPTGTLQLGFELVRNAAKEESPLIQLRVSPNVINTIADVTFYGTDLVGNAISATGSISIEFGNFGDQ